MSRIILSLSLFAFRVTYAEEECRSNECPVHVNTLLQASKQGNDDEVFDKLDGEDTIYEEHVLARFGEDLETILDLDYGERSINKADLYWSPSAAGDNNERITILGLHGAGGTRKSLKYLAEGFCNYGFMFVPLDYRDKQDDEDVQIAANFFYNNRVTYKIGPIYIYGYSAGGSLAATVIVKQDLQHIQGAVVAAGAQKKHTRLIHGKTPPVLWLGCDNDFKVDYKFAKDCNEQLVDVGVHSSHTLYTSGCGHYPMQDAKYYFDIVRFFENPANYTAIEGSDMPMGRWDLISDTSACIKNSENIKPTQTVYTYGYGACQGLCLSKRHEGCIAVDFIAHNRDCNLYTQACSTPQQEEGQLLPVQKPTKGAVSYKWIDLETTTTTAAPELCDKKCAKKMKGSWKTKCKRRICAACAECL